MPGDRPDLPLGGAHDVDTTSQERPPQHATEEVRERVQQKQQELQGADRREAEDLKREAERQAEAGKGLAAERIHAVARALRSAGETLDDEQQRQFAGLGREAADQVDRVAGYLERNDVSGLVEDVEGFARRSPALFLGGAFVGGLLLGRFLRAGPPEPEASEGSLRTSHRDTPDVGRTRRPAVQEDRT